LFLPISLVGLLYIQRNGIRNNSTNSAIATPQVLLNRPTKTNSWFSSFYSFPSFNVFAYPGIFKIDSEGLHVGVPHVSAVEKTEYGNFIPECVISFHEKVLSSSVYSYSDWGVTMQLKGSGFENKVSIVQGSPFVYITGNTQAEFKCDEQFKSRYVFQQFKAGESRLTILPVEKTFDQTTLTNLQWNPIIDTQITHSTEKSEIQTRLQFLTETPENTAIALLPHQTYNTKESLNILGHYETAVGQMSLIMGKQVTVSAAQPQLPFTFTAVTNLTSREKIKSAILEDVSRILSESVPTGVYFRGTYVGSLATVVQLADVYGLHTERDLALQKLEEVVKDQLEKVSYSKEKTMALASNSEFGHEFGNDHHFHWGYYIRAAAILSSLKPEVQSSITPKIETMIADIAESERTSSMYPFLRTFSPYESHSWADGRGFFADGNNQESTSEALNAWYGVALWGEVTKNATYKDLGTWLFSQELIGTKTYWFGENNPFPSEYGHPIASLVWGGKRDFATWFSGQAMHIYGIQFLPITPASGYLKNLPAPDTYIQDLNEGGETVKHEWGDLFVAYKSYNHPFDALSDLPNVNSTSGLKLKSVLLQTVLLNGEMNNK